MVNPELIAARTEWRVRLTKALLTREFDDETLIAMLDAGWDKAHEEGVEDAAGICDSVAAQIPDERAKQTATVLGNSCRELIKKNRETNSGFAKARN